MKIKNVKLEWYVIYLKNEKVVNYNIFWKDANVEIADRIKKNKIDSYDSFKNNMKSMFMYYYWSKTECEMLISGLFSSNTEKIDIWRQIEMNFDKILEYIIEEMKIEF